jgi:hypothetical protein
MTIDDSYSDYDENASWPVLFDDFVRFQLEPKVIN